ncbi:hypothetical protein [uncultured Trichococcus sp.]|uniref:SF0329 family protein n=1 Tax=uncultured Trichococcus sp. TaxID=189665 RepID=UPI0029C94C2E|nr:hypothetical protein [uncultured Trichococcus sp.]
MIWSKMKPQLENFLAPALVGRVVYLSTSYRYSPDKSGQCCIAVDNKKIFNMKDGTTGIRWYLSEQDIKNDPAVMIPLSESEIEQIRKETGGKVPEERLAVIASDRKLLAYAKGTLAAQTALSKSDFYKTANMFLSQPIEDSLASRDILLNCLALLDRRVGKKRIMDMEQAVKMKHPIVQYFYGLRRSAK